MGDYEKAARSLTYDPITGVVYRIFANRPQRVASVCANGGYKRVFFGGKYRMAHRIAWLLYYGNWPSGEIDHIDGNRSNNAIKNLRIVTINENRWNRKATNSASKFKGITKHNRTGKWQAQIKHQGASVYLGLYPSEELAAAAYDGAARAIFGVYGKYNFAEASG